MLSQTGDNDVTFMDTAPDSFVMSQWQHDHMFLVWGEVVNMEYGKISPQRKVRGLQDRRQYG